MENSNWYLYVVGSDDVNALSSLGKRVELKENQENDIKLADFMEPSSPLLQVISWKLKFNKTDGKWELTSQATGFIKVNRKDIDAGVPKELSTNEFSLLTGLSYPPSQTRFLIAKDTIPESYVRSMGKDEKKLRTKFEEAQQKTTRTRLISKQLTPTRSTPTPTPIQLTPMEHIWGELSQRNQLYKDQEEKMLKEITIPKDTYKLYLLDTSSITGRPHINQINNYPRKLLLTQPNFISKLYYKDIFDPLSSMSLTPMVEDFDLFGLKYNNAAGQWLLSKLYIGQNLLEAPMGNTIYVYDMYVNGNKIESSQYMPTGAVITLIIKKKEGKRFDTDYVTFIIIKGGHLGNTDRQKGIHYQSQAIDAYENSMTEYSTIRTPMVVPKYGQTGGNAHYRKYMKYKMKYTELKRSMRN